MAGRPDVKVTLVNQGGYLDLFDKLMASAKADQLPTMAQVYSNRLSWYISKDLVDVYKRQGKTAEDSFAGRAIFQSGCKT